MNGDIGDRRPIEGGGREKSAGNGGKIGAEMVDTRRSHLAAVFLLSDGWTRHADVADGRTDVGGFGEHFGYFTGPNRRNWEQFKV